MAQPLQILLMGWKKKEEGEEEGCGDSWGPKKKGGRGNVLVKHVKGGREAGWTEGRGRPSTLSSPNLD